jgi:hypothetical protein
MQKTAILFVLFIVCAITMHAQGTWLKLNVETGYRNLPDVERPTAPGNRVLLETKMRADANFSLAALRIIPGKRFWEMSISGRKFAKSDVASAYQDSVSFVKVGEMDGYKLGLTMEYGFSIGPVCNDDKNRHSFFTSFFMNPLIQQTRFFNPTRSIDYNKSIQQIGINLGISPRIIYRENKRIIFDCSLKLPLLNFRYEKRDYKNPALTERQQKSTSLDFGMFDGMVLRLGIGWRPKKAQAPVDQGIK